MKITAHILTLVILTLVIYAPCQSDSAGQCEWMAEQYSESTGLDPDEEDISQHLSSRRKINLNRADPSVLAGIPALTPKQAGNLSDYLAAWGEVYSLYELLGIEGFDSGLVRRLAMYAETGPGPDPAGLTPRDLLRKGRHELVVRYGQIMQRQAGYAGRDTGGSSGPGSRYLGSPQRYWFRYRYNVGDRIIIGLSGDKDAGEEFFRGSQPAGMDFYSGFISVQNIRWLKQIIIGHFRFSSGQGLTVGGSSFGRAVNFGTQHQCRDGFRPSQSVSGCGYLRGGALTVQAGGFEGYLFASVTKRDAEVTETDSGGSKAPLFSSFSETGYHRTPRELENRKRIREQAIGGRFSYRGRFFITGTTFYYGTWSGTYRPGDDPYRKFYPGGSRFAAIGADGRIRAGFAQLFGEISVSLNGGKAWLAGVWAVPVPGTEIYIICRSYQARYQNPLSTAMGQGATASNEQGVFLKIRSQPSPVITLTGYIDLFRFPWLRYRVNGPSTGAEGGIMGQFQPSPALSVAVAYSLRYGELNGPGEYLQTHPLAGERRDDIRVQAEIAPGSRFALKSRFVYRTCRADGLDRVNGYLAYQEAAYRSAGFIRAVRVSYSLFDIPGWDTRIYMREPDLLYSWSSCLFYGRGFRCVGMIQAGIAKWLEVTGWIGATRYTDRETIGTGAEEIGGNLRSEVKVQVRLKF